MQNDDKAAFEQQIALIRPKLHRYCARMVGSVLDAEDIVQDSLIRAYAKWPDQALRNPEGWLFRIAHNRAIDHLRRQKRLATEPLEDHPIVDLTEPPFAQKEIAELALGVYMQLTPLQRSSFILKDVLGFSVAEVAEMLEISPGSVKSVVHRARQRLKTIAPVETALVTPDLTPMELRALNDYVERFTRRDFEGIRARLVEDVRLDLVNRVRKRGIENVRTYYGNYGQVDLVAVTAVQIENRPAVLVVDREGSYLIVLEFQRDGLRSIRDFCFARYIMTDATLKRLPAQ